MEKGAGLERGRPTESVTFRERYCQPKVTTLGEVRGTNPLLHCSLLFSTLEAPPLTAANRMPEGKEPAVVIHTGRLPRAKAGCRRGPRRPKEAKEGCPAHVTLDFFQTLRMQSLIITHSSYSSEKYRHGLNMKESVLL